MPELADVLTKESVHRLHNKFKEGVMYLQDAQGGAKELGITSSAFDTVAEPMLRYVHQQMMAQSTINNTTVLPEFPRISRTKVSAILKTNHVGYVRLIGDVTRLLQYAGVARYNRKDATWYLRDWSYANVAFIGTTEWARIRPDPGVERRIKEEEGTPVHTSYNLKGFKAPDSTPESIIEFVEKFIPAAMAVQAERDAALLEVQKLELQIVELKGDVAWEGIGTKINSLLHA